LGQVQGQRSKKFFLALHISYSWCQAGWCVISGMFACYLLLKGNFVYYLTDQLTLITAHIWSAIDDGECSFFSSHFCAII